MAGPLLLPSGPSAFCIFTDGTYDAYPNMIDAKGNIIFSELTKVIPTIELLPNKPGQKSNYLAYVDEEGAINGKHQNALAAFVLDAAGFDLGCCIDGIVFGDVVLVSEKDKGLTPERTKWLYYACRWFSARDEPPSDGDYTRDPEREDKDDYDEDALGDDAYEDQTTPKGPVATEEDREREEVAHAIIAKAAAAAPVVDIDPPAAAAERCAVCHTARAIEAIMEAADKEIAAKAEKEEGELSSSSEEDGGWTAEEVGAAPGLEAIKKALEEEASSSDSEAQAKELKEDAADGAAQLGIPAKAARSMLKRVGSPKEKNPKTPKKQKK
jgi:mono/diheme cytochrome c family protein